MLSDKANAESRMKSLEEKLTLNEDVVTKVRHMWTESDFGNSFLSLFFYLLNYVALSWQESSWGQA